MSSPVKAIASGMAAALLLTAATNAAPLVLGEEAMSQMRTSYRLTDPGQAATQSGLQGAAMVLHAMPMTAPPSNTAPAFVVGPFRPAARPDRATSLNAHDIGPASAAPRIATGSAGAPTRRLSDDEADQVTAAGFLFPVAAAINVRAVVARPSMVFTPVARSITFMRDVIVVPRPSPSMIVEVGKF